MKYVYPDLEHRTAAPSPFTRDGGDVTSETAKGSSVFAERPEDLQNPGDTWRNQSQSHTGGPRGGKSTTRHCATSNGSGACSASGQPRGSELRGEASGTRCLRHSPGLQGKSTGGSERLTFFALLSSEVLVERINLKE